MTKAKPHNKNHQQQASLVGPIAFVTRFNGNGYNV
jgi:hypothetical protein